MKKTHLLLAILLFLSSCKDDETPTTTSPPVINDSPNILLIIADDLGKDALNGFTEGSIKPTTPNIDAIRNTGLSFSNFWSYPTCSPTRASIITGKYGYRTGVKWAGDELAPSETTLQKYIGEETNNTYTSAIVGKWHLSGNNGNTNPETFGMDHYAGVIRGAVQDYFQWQLSEDGSGMLQSNYITEAFTDLSIDWIQDQSKPWFLWLAYNAPHTPFHLPPDDMHNQGNLPAYEDGLDPMPYYMAAIEAMDFQIGRLLDSLSTEERENTLIIFMGDNGTPTQVAQSPYSASSAKGSLYQGGVNVPMFISGKTVSRVGTDDNLITSTDLFATIAEVAGVDVPEINDSKSFKPLLSESSTIRNYQYAELNNDNENSWAIRNDAYKLIVNTNGNEELYDLVNDPYEQNDLLNNTLSTDESNVKMELETELENIRQ